MNEKTTNAERSQTQCPPDNLVTRVWQELTRATKDRHHHWRTPAIASIGLDGSPQVRTVVLRHANQADWILEAYTDSRSPKYLELIKDNRAQMVFWSDRLGWQLRVSVKTSVHVDGDYVENTWARISQSKSSKDYLGSQAPGTKIISNEVSEGPIPQILSEHYLAVLRFQIISMDWLELGKGTHRRAQINADGLVSPLYP